MILVDFLACILIEINVFVINKLSATRMTTAYVLVRVVEGDSKVAICDQFVHKILESDFNDNFHILFEKALVGENIEKLGGRELMWEKINTKNNKCLIKVKLDWAIRDYFTYYDEVCFETIDYSLNVCCLNNHDSIISIACLSPGKLSHF